MKKDKIAIAFSIKKTGMNVSDRLANEIVWIELFMIVKPSWIILYRFDI